MATNDVLSININKIEVTDRHRKDVGDIEALAESIKAIGLLHPIVITPERKLIAGERRLLAFKYLNTLGGRDYVHIPATIADNLSDALLALQAERDENTCRKDFAPSEAVELGKQLEKIEKPKAKERQSQLNGKSACGNFPQASNGKTRDKVGSAVGMSGKTYEKAKEVVYAAETLAMPELVTIMDNKSVEAAYKEMKRAETQKKRQADTTPVHSSVLVGDIREIGAQIADNSVDLILTDPPYLAEYMPLYSDLSRFANRVLRPGGLCLVYSGQIHLPEAYNRLGECLEYFWTFAIRHTGGAQRIFKAGINTAWKPVLGFVKPPMSIFWDSFIDVVSGGIEKDLHDWQQAEGEAAYFIEHLSLPGSVVLDPFAGSGTVLSAAKKLGRQYLGIEIDEQTARVASRRLT